MGLKILFEDEQIMVVKKDAGIPVQAGKLPVNLVAQPLPRVSTQ